jgi:hypothetical protein
MIPAGLVNSIVAWATGDEDRIARLVAARDELVEGFIGITGGADKARKSMTSGAANGKSFTFNVDLTRDEKLTALTAILNELGVAPAGAPTVTYGTFVFIRR